MVDITADAIIGGRYSKSLQDFIDSQNEINGADVPRIQRFRGPENENTAQGRRKKAEQQRFRRTLDELMRDPEYKRLYIELGDKLSRAEREADTAIDTVQAELKAAQEAVAVIEANAARDPDGRSVFQYADGRVVYADKSEVPAVIAEGIIWPNNAPTADEFFAALDQRNALSEHLQDWQSYRNEVLGDVRHHYDDPDNPFEDKDALRDALERIEERRPELGAVKTEAPQHNEPVTTSGLSALNKPVTLN